MKRASKIIACLALSAVCAVSAAACKTKSDLTKEGWEELVDSAFTLEKYTVSFGVRENGNPNGPTEFLEIDWGHSSGPTAHYRKEQSLDPADDAEKYFAVRTESVEGEEVEKVWSYDWKQFEDQGQTYRATVREEIAPSADETPRAAFTALVVQYDLLRPLLALKFFPEGQTEGIGLKDIYDHLSYEYGDWVGDMGFELKGERYDGSVSIKTPYDIEAARDLLTTGGSLIEVRMQTTVDGVETEWFFVVSSATMSNLSLPSVYQEA